jgi:putative tryptophan/tyrosine transport system substrate-binding protein
LATISEPLREALLAYSALEPRRALLSRHPVIASNRRYAELGAMISFGTDISSVFRRAAEYVDKILKGVKPAELPVEQPARSELIINLKTAKELGINVPQSLVVRADEVIQ